MFRFAWILERFVSFRRIPMRVVVITALASYALQIGTIVLGYPLYVIAFVTLLPWIPALLFEWLWKFEHYNWIAVFAVVTALQIGHLGEHAFQVTQIAALNGTTACPPPVDNEENAVRARQLLGRPESERATGSSASNVIMPNREGLPATGEDGKNVIGPAACGVFGRLDFETIHLVWDTAVWLGALWLLTKFPGNIFLWIAMLAASVHEVEHLFIGWIFFAEKDLVYNYMKQLWATTLDGRIVTAHPVGKVPELTTFYEAGGKIGLMGRNGLVESLILDPNNSRNILPVRPYLHFGYNTLVVIPTVLGFLWQSRKVYDEYLAQALPDLTEEQLIRATPKLERLKFEPGHVILRQGDPADKFYIITKGQVEVLRHQPDGQEIVITRLGSGQYFGEIGLLHGGRRTATVRAADDVEAMALDRETFRGLMTESEVTREQLDRIVRQRVVQLRMMQGA